MNIIEKRAIEYDELEITPAGTVWINNGSVRQGQGRIEDDAGVCPP